MCLGKMLDKNKNRGLLQPYLRNVNVRWFTFDLSDLKEMRFEENETEKFSLRDGDLVICEGGEPGRAAVWRGQSEKAKIQKALHRVRFCEDEYDATFAMYFIYYGTITNYFASYYTGTTIKHLTGKALSQVRFPVPPLDEQRCIVSKIEELFSDLDAGVKSLERAKANLKRYRASVLKAAVEGRLTADWRATHPDIEPASELLKRILSTRRQTWESNQLAEYERKGKKPPAGWKDNYDEPVSPQKVPDVVLPSGWCWATVDQLATVGTGTTPKRSERRFYDGGTIPWVTSTAVNEPNVYVGNGHVTEIALTETTLKLYPKHTLIVALYGEGKTRGKVSELQIEATINQALGSLVLDGEAETVRPYLKLFLDANYINLRRKAAGGMQPNLNLSVVKETVVALPPHIEQQRIVDLVEYDLSFEAAVLSQLGTDGVKAERLRQSILKHAFAGKLVSQNEADEPASALLARIVATRMKNSDEKQGDISPNPNKKVPRMKKPQRRPLLEVLHEQKKAISPERLMNEAGFRGDEIDLFYAELKTIKAKIIEVRPNEEKQNRWPYDEKTTFLIEAK